MRDRDLLITRAMAYKRYVHELGLDRLAEAQKIQMLWQTGWGEGWYASAKEAQTRLRQAGELSSTAAEILDMMITGGIDA
jgi:hypothetical protein